MRSLKLFFVDIYLITNYKYNMFSNKFEFQENFNTQEITQAPNCDIKSLNFTITVY